MSFWASLDANGPKWLSISAVFSLILHLCLVGVATQISTRSKVNEDSKIFPDVEIQVISKRNIENLQEEAQKAPERADFISDRNLSTDRETTAPLKSTNVFQPPSGASAAQQGNAKSKPSEKIESFSLSAEDKLALNDPLLGGQIPESPRPASESFEEKLRIGDRLKVNAFQHGASGFYSRMNRKLGQMWDWRSSLEPGMYKYAKITAIVSIVLNRDGELVDVRLHDSSFFKSYDRAAIEAIRASAPFPNPPESIVQKDGQVYMTWAFNLYTENYGLAVVD